MKLSDLIQDLEGEGEALNQSLELLEAIVIEENDRFITTLIEIIHRPSKIRNTNKFASLLGYFQSERFIEPLLSEIEKAEITTCPWLADYLYALEGLLHNNEYELEIKDELVHKLGQWLLSTDGGEISWKSGNILAYSESGATLPYLLKGAKNTALFHLTRIACLRGIINNFRPETQSLAEELTQDSHPEIREAAGDALAWLKERNS